MARQRRAERKFKMENRPWMVRAIKDAKEVPYYGRCGSCDTPLGIKGGCADTGLCGPCATGEAATVGEKFDTW